MLLNHGVYIQIYGYAWIPEKATNIRTGFFDIFDAYYFLDKPILCKINYTSHPKWHSGILEKTFFVSVANNHHRCRNALLHIYRIALQKVVCFFNTQICFSRNFIHSAQNPSKFLAVYLHIVSLLHIAGHRECELCSAHVTINYSNLSEFYISICAPMG